MINALASHRNHSGSRSMANAMTLYHAIFLSLLMIAEVCASTSITDQSIWTSLFGDSKGSLFPNSAHPSCPPHLLHNASWECGDHLSVLRNSSSLSYLFDPEAHLDLLLDSSPSAYDSESDRLLFGRDIRLVRRIWRDGDYWSAMAPIRPDERIDSALVKQAFRAGYTLVFNRMNYRWPPLSQLCNMITNTLGFRCTINLYFTPKSATGSQGFEAHFDTMQSIIVQLRGAKRWSIHSNASISRQPLYGDSVKIAQSSINNHSNDLTLDLWPSSVFYIPSGLVHQAHALPLHDSLHLTIGIEIDAAFTVSGFLHFAVHSLPTEPTKLDSICVPGMSWTWRQVIHLALHALAILPESIEFRRTMGFMSLDFNASASASIWMSRARVAWLDYVERSSLSALDLSFLCRILPTAPDLAPLLGVSASQCPQLDQSSALQAPYRVDDDLWSWWSLPTVSDTASSTVTLLQGLQFLNHSTFHSIAHSLTSSLFNNLPTFVSTIRDYHRISRAALSRQQAAQLASLRRHTSAFHARRPRSTSDEL
jgi:hypothetical protein